MSEGEFFQDLAMMMVVAGTVAVIFSRLKWPKVLGYIAAGIVMSENTWGGSFLVSPNTISTIAQLGIVFLMFAMGLSFSLRDLKRIQGVVLPCAIADTVFMIWLGYTIGVRVFGWSMVQSVFLGVAICDSATTLLAKVIDEMKWSDRPFAKFVLGTSVCEDLVCVGAIAVATGLAGGNGVSAKVAFVSLGGLVVFLLAVLVFGLILYPRLLVSVAKQRDGEAFDLTVLGGCFLVAWIAYYFDFSLAIGAFLVGFLAANSDVKQKVEPVVAPLKSMFSAMFFISIGLLVDPRACWAHAPAILFVSAAVIFGKLIVNTVVSLLTGLEVKTAVQNGFSLAQIGEFAFMTAILYMGLVEDSTNPMFQIAVGASLLTTLLNPAMILISDPVGDWAARRMPERLRKLLVDYRGWLSKLGESRGSPEFIFLRKALVRLGVYATLAFAVFFMLGLLSHLDFSRFSVFFERHDSVVFFLLANFFTVGLLPLIVKEGRMIGTTLGDLLLEGAGARWMLPVRQFVRFIALAAAIGLYFLEWTMLNVSLAPKGGWPLGVAMVVIVVTGIVGWKFFAKTGARATLRLNEALASEQRRSKLGKMLSVQVPEGVYHELTLGQGSPAVGETVVSLNIRARTGVTVVAVRRGETTVRNIGPEFEFQVGDILVTTGRNSQISALEDLLSERS